MRALADRQRGVVSLIVTMIMMIVITLLVLGFAEISRNEQRSSLDDQLSAQAYYAAESGVNAARAVIDKEIASGGPTAVQPKSTCADQANYNLPTTVYQANGATYEYTCVIVDPSPPHLTYTVNYDSNIIPLQAGSGKFSSIRLNWTAGKDLPATANNCKTSLSQLRDNPIAAGSGSGAWSCNYPILRVDMVDTSGSLTRSSWDARTATMFFVPFNAVVSSSVAFSGAHGTSVATTCTTGGCNATISGLNSPSYYMRVTTIYRSDSSLTLTAPGTSFVGAQATIDSTGKAIDVLRRILVAVDLTDANAYNIPSAAIVTRDSVCKQFSVTDTTFQVYNTLDGAAGNYYCQLRSLP